MKLAKNNGVSPDLDMEKSIEQVNVKRNMRQVFIDFAEKTSLNGVPFINAARSPVIKIIWAVLLAAAVGAMIYHLYTLIDKYLQYSKHSEIDISFSNLAFPAVTICNVNILRLSKLSKASQSIQDLVNTVDPNNLLRIAVNYNETSDVNAYYDSYDQYGNDTENDVGQISDFFDSIDLNITNLRSDIMDAYYDQSDPDSNEAKQNTSAFSKIEDQFKDLYSEMDIKLQKSIGHQIDDMLVQCNFGKRVCKKKFSQITTPSYGNCYTIQDKDYVSRKSGPGGGLELILFLEVDEYIPGITSAKGAQLVLHDQGTLPFPEEEGLAIPAGQQTLLSLKKIKITRLGDPYSPCSPVEDFVNKYNVTYTRNALTIQYLNVNYPIHRHPMSVLAVDPMAVEWLDCWLDKLCQKICELKMLLDECKCVDDRYQMINNVMNVPSATKGCSSEQELKCLARITRRFTDSENACECLNPCSENAFEKSLSYRQWPSTAMAKVMAETACKTRSDVVCDQLKNKDGQELQENFLKLNIFYQDLNYEEMTEQPNYESSQMLSDVGGSIGLWIGLSVLAIFELVHLLLEIIDYFTLKRC